MKKILSVILLGSLVTVSDIRTEPASNNPFTVVFTATALCALSLAAYTQFEIEEGERHNWNVNSLINLRRNLAYLGVVSASWALTSWLFLNDN